MFRGRGFGRFPYSRRGRITRRINNAIRRRVNTDSRLARTPSSMPTISLSQKGTRWLRFNYTRPAVGAWVLTAQALFLNCFGVADASAAPRNSYLYIHRLRIWLESGGDETSTLAGRLIASPTIPSGSTTHHASMPAAFYRDDSVAGATYACISMEMPEYWKRYPISSLSTIQLFVLDTATITPVAAVPVPFNAASVTVDALVQLHVNTFLFSSVAEIHHDDEESGRRGRGEPPGPNSGHNSRGLPPVEHGFEMIQN